MIEQINLLKTISLFLIVLGILLLGLSVFIAWKGDLLTYYKVKFGKPKAKASATSLAAISQYDSEDLVSTDTHEIVDFDYMADTSTELENKVYLGGSESGVVNQIIDDETPLDFKTSGGDEEGFDETMPLMPNITLEDGSKETSVLNSDVDGSDETALLTQDAGLDQTEVVEIQPDPSFIDKGLDETQVVVIGFDDEPIRETTELNSEPEENNTDVTIPLYDINGEDETVVLNSDPVNKNVVASEKLWSPQITSFVISKEDNAVKTSKDKGKKA